MRCIMTKLTSKAKNKQTVTIAAHDKNVFNTISTSLKKVDVKASFLHINTSLLRSSSYVPSSSLTIIACDTHLIITKNSTNTACPACIFAQRLAKKGQHSQESFMQGIDVDICAPRLLTPNVQSLLNLLISHILKAQTVGAWALDLYINTLTHFTTKRYDNCTWCTVPFSLLQSRTLKAQTRSSSNSSRNRQLKDIKLPLDGLIDPICGLLGDDIFYMRQASFCIYASSQFQDPFLNKKLIVPWLGMAESFADCRTAGLIEGLERHAGLYPRAKHIISASYNDLGPKALHPNSLGTYEDIAYRVDTHLRHFNEDMKVDWVDGWDIFTGQQHFTLKNTVYYGQIDFLHSNSNGCASGTTQEEALLFSILELLERDAFVFHWLAGASPPHIDLSSIKDPVSYSIINRVRASGGEIYLLDGRLDFNVPIVFSVFVHPTRKYGNFAFASGASFDPEEAIRKAIFEVAMSLDSLEERAHEAEARGLSTAPEDYYHCITSIEDHTILYALPNMREPVKFLTANTLSYSVKETYNNWEAKRPRTPFLTDDLLYLLTIIRQAGFTEILAFDQTSPTQKELGLHTTRVIIPGLLPIDFGHAKTRGHRLPRFKKLQRNYHHSLCFPAGTHNPNPHPYP